LRPVFSNSQRLFAPGSSISGGVMFISKPRFRQCDSTTAETRRNSPRPSAKIWLFPVAILKCRHKERDCRREPDDTRTVGVRLQPMLWQIHVCHNVRADWSRGVSEPGAAEARMKFFGDGAAADNGPSFEYQGLESGLGEIERGDQAVVSCAEDDDVVSLWHVA
jgi:hypothetical protein